VIAAANPLRSLDRDAASVADLLRTLEGPLLLVAHSYGGAVISNVPAEAGEITGLVYVNGFAPDPGESCFALAAKFPGSQLGEETSRPVPRSDGTTDLYIVREALPGAVLRRRGRARGSADGGNPAAGDAAALVAPSGSDPSGASCPPGS
jgi:pimeloyl-ACP methyl ester carboxylesterase